MVFGAKPHHVGPMYKMSWQFVSDAALHPQCTIDQLPDVIFVVIDLVSDVIIEWCKTESHFSVYKTNLE